VSTLNSCSVNVESEPSISSIVFPEEEDSISFAATESSFVFCTAKVDSEPSFISSWFLEQDSSSFAASEPSLDSNSFSEVEFTLFACRSMFEPIVSSC